MLVAGWSLFGGTAGAGTRSVQVLGLDEDAGRLREGGHDGALDAVDGVVDRFAVDRVLERHVDGDQQVARPQVQRQDAPALAHVRVGLHDARQTAQLFPVQALADEKDLHLAQQDDGNARQQHADEYRRDAVEVRVARQMPQQRAQERQCQADFGRRVLEHDGEQAGVLRLADEPQWLHVAARGVELAQGNR